MTQVHSRQTAVALLLPACPRSDRADGAEPVAGAAAAAALIPVAVDFGFRALTNYLARLESERTGNWLATGAGPLPDRTTGQTRGCIVIARGRIGEGERLVQQGSLAPGDMRAVGLVTPPDFYMEARLEVSPHPARPGQAGGADIVLRPQLVHFARTIARRGTTEPKAIGMVLVLRGTPLPDQPTRTNAAQGADTVFALNLGTITPGQEIRPTILPVRDDRPGHPLSDLVQTSRLPSSSGIVNIGAFVTETAEPNRVLVLLNETLAARGGALQTALSTALQDAVKQALAPEPRAATP